MYKSSSIELISQENLLENDDNLSYFPSINNPNHLNRGQGTFLNNSNNTGLFNDLLPNPISTNTFLNNRQQPTYKPPSTMTFAQQQQQQVQQSQSTRNDENVFHNNHPHGNSVNEKLIFFFLNRIIYNLFVFVFS